MPKFKRKPTFCNAEQFTDYTKPVKGVSIEDAAPSPRAFVITMQGQKVYVDVGEWIVAESSGDGFYPIADKEFKRIYEPAE